MCVRQEEASHRDATTEGFVVAALPPLADKYERNVFVEAALCAALGG
jgi:hypothetical protein